ncbi:putative hydro-lyase [Pseudomonas sp. PS1]|uniref:Putative hydro-lyase MST27_11885 n=1 Tax=Stutzerimonas marianensis TaxID=2929513 RepID=A0A9X1W5R8_9GAMM|nr:putative hydro-lyase [Pseudomonas marianensis]MCJ0974069.1 putative hydro-lyase [Pseudomonas marianensis]
MDTTRYRHLSPVELRQRIRQGELSGPTAGLANGYAQANLMIVRRDLAYDFLLFCQRNPKPCPLLDVTDVGSFDPRRAAPGADIRTDFPRYRVYRNGELEQEVPDITAFWEDDMVAFLIGCSFSFEGALLANGVPVRHIEDQHNVPMYRTNIACQPAGTLRGPMVVSMRPMPADKVVRAVQVTSRFPSVHGAPVHIGDPARLGIADLAKPDFGEASQVREGEVPVFWACGVTPQAVAMQARPELVITHAPGHMFITDLRDEQLGVI